MEKCELYFHLHGAQDLHIRECLPHIKNLQEQLEKYELNIYGKTPMLPSENREDEILEYIDIYEVKQMKNR